MQFIDAHRVEHGVEPICRALEDTCAQIAPSTYYAARGREPSARSVSDSRVLAEIRELHAQNYSVYGARKTWKALVRAGHQVARCTVERLMRGAGIKGVAKNKAIPRTTIPARDDGRPADLVDRDFTADAPDRLWAADITYIRCLSGWVYTAFVMDIFARRIVGWQVSESLHTALALDALEMALWQRQRAGHDVSGLVHHSDRGVQYRAVRYTQRLAEAEAVASVGSKGDSYDNAAAESLNSSFKAELIRNRAVLDEKGPWKGLDHVEIAVAEWVDWYNTARLHGSLGDILPAEFEAAYYHQHQRPQPVAATP